LNFLEWAGRIQEVAYSVRIKRCDGGSALRLQVQRTTSEGIASYLEGVLDRQSVPVIRRKLLGAARETGVSHMVVDLSKVSAIDTAGIAMLVELLRVLAEKSGRLRLVGLNEKTSKMIRLSRLDSLFHVDNHLESGS